MAVVRSNKVVSQEQSVLGFHRYACALLLRRRLDADDRPSEASPGITPLPHRCLAGQEERIAGGTDLYPVQVRGTELTAHGALSHGSLAAERLDKPLDVESQLAGGRAEQGPVRTIPGLIAATIGVHQPAQQVPALLGRGQQVDLRDALVGGKLVRTEGNQGVFKAVLHMAERVHDVIVRAAAVIVAA